MTTSLLVLPLYTTNQIVKELFNFYIRYCIRTQVFFCKFLSASADILFSRYATTAKIRLTLHLLFPIFIVGQIVLVAMTETWASLRITTLFSWLYATDLPKSDTTSLSTISSKRNLRTPLPKQ